MGPLVNRFGVFSLVVSLMLSWSACAPGAKNSTVADDMNSPQLQPATSPSPEYRIRPGDQLDIKFFYNPELNELLVPVRPDGRISLQLAPEVMAGGRTPAELTAALKEIYSAELAKPEIAVILRSFGGQMVFVDGEVNRPGLLTLTGPMTVLQSISQAGGLRDTARRSELILVRRDVANDNRPAIRQINLDKILDGTDFGQDLYLQPFDIVYVPKSAIANVNQWVDQYIRKNLPVYLSIGYTLPTWYW